MKNFFLFFIQIEIQIWQPQQRKKTQRVETKTMASKTETILKRNPSINHRCKVNFLFQRNPDEKFLNFHRPDPPFEPAEPPPPPLPPPLLLLLFLFNLLKGKGKFGFFSISLSSGCCWFWIELL